MGGRERMKQEAAAMHVLGITANVRRRRINIFPAMVLITSAVHVRLTARQVCVLLTDLILSHPCYLPTYRRAKQQRRRRDLWTGLSTCAEEGVEPVASQHNFLKHGCRIFFIVSARKDHMGAAWQSVVAWKGMSLLRNCVLHPSQYLNKVSMGPSRSISDFPFDVRMSLALVSRGR
jgi:hypothetical protein